MLLPFATPTRPDLSPPPLSQARGDQGRLTGDYIRSMRLLQNTSRAVGDLILVYKRVSNLAGHTARVAELLEQVSGHAGGWRCGPLYCAAADCMPQRRWPATPRASLSCWSK